MADDPAAAEADGQPFQALYRRYRPQRFGDVLGQDHVTRALRHSVRDGKVAHAYLFSGPRGTGKTTTARILAMALNCANPDAGEPDGTCPSCVAIRQGSSMDVQELDSATNRGIDEMRDLLSRVALGTPGRWKVYIVDEVHQMTSQAASALLKTLEEPPAHVIFVLATTDPQKVLPTIRSRTQHFEFHLLSADVLTRLLQEVNARAALGLPAESIDLVVRRGHGSARDALSVLDQVAAAGTVDDDTAVVDDLVTALAERDPGRALVSVAEAVTAGRDPRRLGDDILQHLRNGFLATRAPSLVLLPSDAVAAVEAQARQLGTPALVRAMEVIGHALIDMRDSVEPRITLEVALVRLAADDADDSRAALLERIDRLERVVGDPSARKGGADPAPPPKERASVSTPSPAPGSQTALGAHRRPKEAATASFETTAAVEPPAQDPTPVSTSPLPTREELTLAWGDTILPALRPGVKVYMSSGRFVATDSAAAVYAVPDKGLLERADANRAEVEAVLSKHFGRTVPLRLVLDEGHTPESGIGTPSKGGDESPSDYDLTDLQDAPAAVLSPEQRLLEAFPGAEEVSQ